VIENLLRLDSVQFSKIGISRKEIKLERGSLKMLTFLKKVLNLLSTKPGLDPVIGYFINCLSICLIWLPIIKGVVF
jgi:hypothetical protein